MWATRLPDLPRSAALLVPLLQVAGGLLPAAAAEGTQVESSRHGNVVEIRATADLSASRATAWQVLTDYGRYSAFIPGLNESRVLSRNGSNVIVEQAGTAAFGPLHIPVEVTFQIQETPPVTVESRAVSGSFRSLESRYTLASREHGTRLLYTGRVRLAFPLFGSLGQSAIEDNVGREFRALVDEIERQHRGEADPHPEAGR